ncbi:MAG: undecaprenyldiphospho-muramoylpentapeptide beta-N-acetylglucosaminyltransferase [Desulfatiglans sp.]|jgi:UDP-N-acetylglucosamine--N-acetylmuramyl-(pentapeptide) pyrophosphoryl-undecaprenol N-acetylglucosamine transferase|nr:undecaprenyldiphospho-muramoylpentapeptide beta-N-acetylglucosaminyltransferase [Thermodesulfobacteriota bacterium]MEE4351294.1 undecaprenyldiphospho-muramoylpentapeptide beta-N-acetylglucosaminyltransferase [Desulfatiglans sp.]
MEKRRSNPLLSSKMPGIRFLVAGGGTGGHLFPGIAVARELEKRFSNVEILFVAGLARMESEILSRYRYDVTSIEIEGLMGRGWRKGLTVLSRVPRSLLESAQVIRRFSPHLVLGMGAYSAGPVCLAARFMKIPTAIHEQNSYPGLTNRLLSRVVDQVFISFEESRRYFKAGKIFLTGNPVRQEFFSGPRIEREESRFTVLIIGGSQGARALNRAFAEAASILKQKGRQVKVIHQTGHADYREVVADYKRRDVEGDILPFIEDMATAYKEADLVISRAGATTIFELAGLAKPSILVPYPYASHRHQEINARTLVREGGAEMILENDLTGKALSDLVAKYMDDRDALMEMGKRAAKVGRPNASSVIVDQLVKMIH